MLLLLSLLKVVVAVVAVVFSLFQSNEMKKLIFRLLTHDSVEAVYIVHHPVTATLCKEKGERGWSTSILLFLSTKKSL